MHARSLDQRGVAWIKSDGQRRAQMPVTAFHGNGLVSKLQILRGDAGDKELRAAIEEARRQPPSAVPAEDRYGDLKHDSSLKYDAGELYLLAETGRILLACALLNRIALNKTPSKVICGSHRTDGLGVDIRRLLGV
jgi:hypothetical protein